MERLDAWMDLKVTLSVLQLVGVVLVVATIDDLVRVLWKRWRSR